MAFLSVFNVNLDLVGMECIYQTPYWLKWTIIEIIPLASAIILVCVYLILYLYKKIKRVPSEKRHLHADPLIGVFMVIMYYLYLFITRNTFDIFNCSPTEPDDGYEHGYLQVVFEPCFQEGGLHLMLFPWAILSLLVYVIAYPALMTIFLIRNKEKLKIDQYLRAYGIGHTRYTNPYFSFRRRFHKLYYMFKPGKGYWIIVIFSRKALIAVTGLLFSRAPSFQLAFALLVLFLAYAAQMKHLPYMSMSERLAVIFEHEKKVEKQDKLHQKIDFEIRRSLEESKRRDRQAFKSTGMDRIRERAKQAAPVFVLDYNLVESVLLFCAVLVCLGGVMFESQKFDSDVGDYSTQRDILAVILLFIIIVSLLYYAFVFISELARMFCMHRCSSEKQNSCTKLLMGNRKKKSAVEIAGERQRMAERSRDAGLTVNPFILRQGKVDEAMESSLIEALQQSGPPDLNVWTALRNYIKSGEENLDNMQQELASLKRKETQSKASSGLAAYSNAKTRKIATGKKRHQFSQIQSRRSSKSNNDLSNLMSMYKR